MASHITSDGTNADPVDFAPFERDTPINLNTHGEWDWLTSNFSITEDEGDEVPVSCRLKKEVSAEVRKAFAAKLIADSGSKSSQYLAYWSEILNSVDRETAWELQAAMIASLTHPHLNGASLNFLPSTDPTAGDEK